MATIDDDIKCKIEKAKKWDEANPGLSWPSLSYPEEEQKIYITKELLHSKAYRSLSRIALLVYQDLLAKRILKKIPRGKQKVWVIVNNGEIVYTYAEAKRLGISKTQFVNAIDELQQKGFIDITHQGKGGRTPAKGTGDVSKYFIDDRWRDYGTDDFRPPRNPRKKDKRGGRGFALQWNDPERREKMLDKQRLARVKN